MNISIDNALGVHPTALQLRTLRTTVLGNNIAHADTPGFQARDIDFAGELAKHTSRGVEGSLKRTHGGHMNGTNGIGSSVAAGSSAQLKYRTPLMPSVDRNTVNVQAEQAAFAQNTIEMQASMRFLNGKIKGLLTAIKGE